MLKIQILTFLANFKLLDRIWVLNGQIEFRMCDLVLNLSSSKFEPILSVQSVLKKLIWFLISSNSKFKRNLILKP